MSKRSQRGRFNVDSTISTLVCTQCGAKMYVPRGMGQQRGKMHKKHMYCFNCKEITAHLEVRAFDHLKPEGFYIRHELPTSNKNIIIEYTNTFSNNKNKTSLYVYIHKINCLYAPLIYDICNDVVMCESDFSWIEIKNILNEIKNNKQYIIKSVCHAK